MSKDNQLTTMQDKENLNSQNKSGVVDWIEYRLPIFSFIKSTALYRVPKNINYAYLFGSISGILLVIQILTGLFLAMQYTPHIDHAFDSVERIMRDVNYGWLIRYAHAVGASMFFGVVYLHIGRGMYYGSYHSPRELVWISGVIIFITMMATGFLGYVLPWGQMSFWGVTVITQLFSAIPFIGEDLVVWIWGGYSVSNATLNRFFVLHFLLPFVLVAIVMIHMIVLHVHGSSNPSGIEVKDKKKDTTPFHPYHSVKDLFGLGVFFIIYFAFIFFYPNALGHPDNYIEGDPLVTPPHIVPEWYFLPFYAILRSIPNKLLGVIAMFSAILILTLLPWLDGSKVKSAVYRPIFKWGVRLFFVNVVMLGYLGGKPVEEPFVTLSRVCMVLYYSYFTIFLPYVSRTEKTLPLPKSIYEDYKKKTWIVKIRKEF